MAGPVVAEGSVYVSLEQLMLLEHRVRDLSFLSRQPLSSVLSGSHAARLRGRGLSFDELRQYTPGDDLRHLDWRASLRYSKPFVRSYTEERDRPTLLLVDQRMSMYFGSRQCFKSVTAAQLGAIGAWMAFHAGDRVGGLVFNDQQIETVRPLRSRARVEALCSADRVLRQCLGIAGHDHLIVIISDFSGVTDHTLQLLRQLRAHNDVLALQVFDPIALQLPEQGRVMVTQGELQVELEIARRQVHRPLGEFLSARLKAVAALLRRSQVPLMMFSTGLDSLVQLRAELGRLSAVPR